MIKKLFAIILCSSILFGCFGCAPSAQPDESTDDITDEKRSENIPETTLADTAESIPEETSEETKVAEDKKAGAVLAFSSSTAPTSLPNSNSKIVGEFIADFENPDNYFQGEERGGKLVCAVNSDKTPKLFGTQYCSKALLEAGSSGTQGLNLYAKPGQNLSMRSHFHIKTRPDMRNYSGIMLYVDTTRVQWPNSAYISDPNDTKKHTAVSINIILSKSSDNSLTSENYLDDVQSFFSYYNKTVRTIEAFYYDSASGQWVKTSNAFASKHVILVPDEFAGYVYVPFDAYYHNENTSTPMLEYIDQGYAYPARLGVYTGGYDNDEPASVFITVDDIALVRAEDDEPWKNYVADEKEDVVRVEGTGDTAQVTFVLNNKKGDKISYEYSVGKSIYKSDIPKTPNEGNNVFNCWTSDERGLIPCNPQGYTVTGDVTFYGYWFDNTASYATSATEIENRDGGIYNLPKGKVIFYGASNFTRWTTLEKDMAPELDALNHGIGGATDASLLEHLDRLVLRYEPKAVIIQCSNNDVHKYTDAQCKQTKEQLYSRIREALPDTVIIFISHMPLPSRTQYWQSSTRLQDLNVWVKEFCDARENCEYLDVYDDILEIANVYLSGNTGAYFNDSSHFNSAGQKKFCEALKPEIIKILS
jgi:lysophospholipase L1-like esterase